jgi:hypothetical protein
VAVVDALPLGPVSSVIPGPAGTMRDLRFTQVSVQDRFLHDSNLSARSPSVPFFHGPDLDQRPVLVRSWSGPGPRASQAAGPVRAAASLAGRWCAAKGLARNLAAVSGRAEIFSKPRGRSGRAGFAGSALSPRGKTSCPPGPPGVRSARSRRLSDLPGGSGPPGA